MFLKRFYDEKLAQATYLVGCQATGEALVIDASRDVDPILESASREGLRVTHITETHIHADYVSGSRELAHRTGGRVYLSDEGGDDWRYRWGAEEGAVPVRDGDILQVGNLRIEVIHTPGHTPEHLSFLLTDTAGADRPMGIFTGDFVFVGDVGRPDLLEKAAKVMGTMEAGARTLFRSLRKLDGYPDWLQLWPGHGAGSACGKGLGAVPQTTLGYERLFNPGLTISDEDAFVEWVLAGQPEPPAYFAQMKRINRDGPRVLGGLHVPEPLPWSELEGLLEEGIPVVDTRPADAFADGHVPGTLNIPLNRSFITWAGWLLSYDRDFVLLVESADAAAEAARDLAMIGLDRMRGYIPARMTAHGDPAGVDLQTVPRMHSARLLERLEAGEAGFDAGAGDPAAPELVVVDVRGQAEWEAGHIPGARNVPLGYLGDHLDELPRDGTLVLSCRTGARSAIGASLLQAHGFTNVVNLVDGYVGWVGAGHPVIRPEAAAVR
jgi:hydroxyacylglutathione hydrolase